MKEALRVGPGQLLVDVKACGVNYLDVYQRSGRYNLTLPYTPGFEGVGRVRQVGEPSGSVAGGFELGQRIAWINAFGSYASQVVVPTAQAIPLPDEFTTLQALMFQGLTAEYLVSEYRDIHPGDQVLVHSAAGGVGSKSFSDCYRPDDGHTRHDRWPGERRRKNVRRLRILDSGRHYFCRDWSRLE